LLPPKQHLLTRSQLVVAEAHQRGTTAKQVGISQDTADRDGKFCRPLNWWDLQSYTQSLHSALSCAHGAYLVRWEGMETADQLPAPAPPGVRFT
jgi:hypothetical protein